ncbi:MAG: FecR domain-containing protein, partial [Terrimicrobiaceae bacterium]|nr:FecR domain-containing protein [Terrimicrobiaceae bacterium]
NDSTIARLGANSVFSFSRGTRGMEVNSGVMLLQVPKNAGGATIQAGAVTAAVTGTTVAIEHFPGTSSAKPVFKLLCLEGRVRAFLRGLPGESVLLDPGQMIIYNMQGRLPDPVVFDLARLVRTSGLLSKDFGEL